MDSKQLELMLKNYAKASDLEDLAKRMEKCEKKSKKAKENSKKAIKKAKKLKEKFKDLSEKLSELDKRKVDFSIFDEEINNLKNLIAQLVSSGKEIKMPVITPQFISKEV